MFNTGPFSKYHLIYTEVHYLDNPSVPVRGKRRVHIDMYLGWHWSNEEKCIQHIERIIVPYLKAKREELDLSPDQKALLIFDVFKGHKTEKYRSLLDMYDIIAV